MFTNSCQLSYAMLIETIIMYFKFYIQKQLIMRQIFVLVSNSTNIIVPIHLCALKTGDIDLILRTQTHSNAESILNLK